MPTPTQIRAAAPPTPSRLSIQAAGSVEFEAAKGEGKRPTFSIVGYTGSVMNISGFYSPVIVDLNGLKAASGSIPILFGHDPNRIVGQTDAVKIDAAGVNLTGVVTGDNADATEVVTQAKNGFKWQASIGADIDRREFLDAGKTATVNGREVVGPMVIARESTIFETSFVAIGADGQTSANVAASLSLGSQKGAPTVFEQWLLAKGFDDPAALSDSQKASLKAMFDAEQAAPKTPAPVTAAAATQSLDAIVARQRDEDKRVAEITQIAAEAITRHPGQVDEIEKMAKAAIDAKSTPTELELAILRATRASAAPAVFSRGGDQKAGARVIEAALCRAGGLEGLEKHYDERTLAATDDRFRSGLGLCDVLQIAARDRGWTGHSVKSDLEGVLRAAMPRLDVRADGFSTLSLPNILSNVANKFLAAGFNAVDNTWRDISAKRPVNDFKQITTASLTGGLMYEKVGPSGEIKHGTLGELVYNNQAETYGRMLAITRRDIINDDLGALTAVPRKLGRGAALSLNDTFWTVFLNNSAFFTSGRANLNSGAGTALAIAGLTTAQASFLNQTDADGYPVAVMPKILLVPPALSVTAMTLMNSTLVANNTTANTTTMASNPFAGLYTVVSTPYLSNSSYTGYSTAAWYLLADPNDLASIEVAFLNGRETPIVESAQAEFDTLGIQFRGFFDYGVATQEYRAGVKNAGS